MMAPRPLWAYVGSRTTRDRNARGEGISVYRVDGGRLQRVQLVDDLVNPSFLALNARGDRLYSVHGDGHEISVFAVSAEGTLRFVQRQDCGGKNPVHLALDPGERFLVVSDHLGQGGGTLAVLDVAADGTLGPVRQRLDLPGTPGPHRQEQPFAKPHFNPFAPDGRHVLVPDKGLDRVFVFGFADGRLVPAAQPWLDGRAGAGPRHLAFHPTLARVYVLNELDSTLTTCAYDAATGALQALQLLSSLSERYTGNSRAAEIMVAPDGRHVYASNRGSDDIAVFAVDAHSGLLALRGHVPTEGRTPRFFTLSPDGRWLFALNEDSDSIVSLAVDPQQGLLPGSVHRVDCGSPVCMVFRQG